MFKILLVFLFTSCGIEVVNSGFMGIKRHKGEISTIELQAGMHFYIPILSDIFELDIREQMQESVVSAYSSDNQIIKVTYKVNYKPIPNKVAELYIKLGENYFSILAPQRVEASVKEVIGKVKATNLVQERQRVSNDAFEKIKNRFSGLDIIITNFEITNFDYDNDFENAVKAKVIAKEQAVEEKNRTVKIAEQAKQAVLRAQAEAKAIRIKAQALSQNKDLIQLEAVRKWNGVLPQYTMGNTVPMINLRSK